ncbi:MAG: zinc ribbon domain-containing protein [Candidatus Hermodarchaeota archaeon]
MTKKGFLLILNILLFLNTAIFLGYHPEIKPINERKIFEVRLSYECSLAYGESVGFHANAGEDDRFEWEFSGTNNYVGIRVMAMTDIEYSKFQNLGIYYYYSLSDGSYYRDSGIFKPPSYDHWYIIFFNNDPDMQTTYLTYDVMLDRGDSGNGFESILYPIIAIIIIGGFVGICVGISEKSKKKKEIAEVKLKGVPIQIQQESIALNSNHLEKSIKYCPNCGVPHKLNAIYCLKCGNKFDQFI